MNIEIDIFLIKFTNQLVEITLKQFILLKKNYMKIYVFDSPKRRRL